jgi:hypothetical protein
VDKTALTSLRESLEHARQLIEYVIGRLRVEEEPRALQWRCRRCEHVARFATATPQSGARPCRECGSERLDPLT